MEIELHAINHWEVAVETHSRNHPWARHYCEEVQNVDPVQAVGGGGDQRTDDKGAMTMPRLPTNIEPAKCADCEIEDGYTQTLWTAGGDRIGDYREFKEEILLCDNCASLYGICEECGDLIADEVFVPPGGDVLCPACRDNGNVADDDNEEDGQ